MFFVVTKAIGRNHLSLVKIILLLIINYNTGAVFIQEFIIRNMSIKILILLQI